MQEFLYRFAVAQINSNDDRSAPIVEFTSSHHEDLQLIISKLSERVSLEHNELCAFACGLKLLGEVLMKSKNDPLLKALRPHIGQMKKLVKQNSIEEQK